MSRIREILALAAIAACGSVLSHRPANGAEPAVPSHAQPPGGSPQADAAAPSQAPAGGTLARLVVTVGKSLIIDSPVEIRRLSVANGDLAEAVAVNPKEVLINGKAPGETTLIVWQQNGTRLLYDLTVRMSTTRLDAVRQQIARDFPNEEINVTYENDTAFVRGRVHDLTAADRVIAIASTLGKTVNLLRADVPPVEQQVVLKVKFANVDRSASSQIGANFFNQSFNQQSHVGTGGSFTTIDDSGRPKFSIGSAVNVFLQRPDINLAAAITALQNQNILELLAEPNLLAVSGQQASFLAGGEFPFPVVQPSSNGGTALSIMWREYGVRLNFQPTVTARGTIRLKVAPEVSSLDYGHSVTVQGFTIPGLASRRVQTEVELDSGQSFVIAGLLDNQTSETLSKVPGIGSVPVLGKLFQSKNISRSNSELMVIITPEVVRPIPAGQPAPELKFPAKFISGGDTTAPANPGLDKTGPVPVKPPFETLPVEELMPKQGQSTTPAPAMYQMVPVMPVAPGPNANSSPGISSPAAAAIPAPASAPPGGGNK